MLIMQAKTRGRKKKKRTVETLIQTGSSGMFGPIFWSAGRQAITCCTHFSLEAAREKSAMESTAHECVCLGQSG